jgi:hypothetical protein
MAQRKPLVFIGGKIHEIPSGDRVDSYISVYDITKYPTGFDSPLDVIVSYDGSTRRITLTGTFVAYFKGIQVASLTNGWVSDAHPDVAENAYFLYYNGSSFVWSTTPWTFDMLLIAYISKQRFGIRECHGTEPWQSHQQFHERFGTYKFSGGALSGYTIGRTTASERRPLVSACTIKDEDCITINAALNSEIYTWHYLASTGTSNFNLDQLDIVNLSTNRPYYNQFLNGTWQQTLMSVNNYTSIWLIAIPVTSDVTSQKYRFVWMQGQSQGTLTEQRNLRSNDLNLGEIRSLSPEYVFIGQIIIRYSGSNWTLEDAIALSGNRETQSIPTSGQFLSVVTTDATLTGDGTPENPLSVVNSGGGTSFLTNVAKYSDTGYNYFVGDTATGWKTNRYNSNGVKTSATGTTNKPVSLSDCQALSYS